MTSWEYHKSTGDRDLEELGGAGWELVAVLPPASGTVDEAIFYFKRPAMSFREQVTLDQKRRYYDLMSVASSE